MSDPASIAKKKELDSKTNGIIAGIVVLGFVVITAIALILFYTYTSGGPFFPPVSSSAVAPCLLPAFWPQPNNWYQITHASGPFVLGVKLTQPNVVGFNVFNLTWFQTQQWKIDLLPGTCVTPNNTALVTIADREEFRNLFGVANPNELVVTPNINTNQKEQQWRLIYLADTDEWAFENVAFNQALTFQFSQTLPTAILSKSDWANNKNQRFKIVSNFLEFYQDQGCSRSVLEELFGPYPLGQTSSSTLV